MKKLGFHSHMVFVGLYMQQKHDTDTVVHICASHCISFLCITLNIGIGMEVVSTCTVLG